LTISDEQFLKGDVSGRPTIISGIFKVAQGSGHLPLVILLHVSGGIEENAVVWERLFGSLGISTFGIDSFTGRGIVSTVADQSQLGRLNMILDLYRSLATCASAGRSEPNCGHGILTRGTSGSLCDPQKIPKDVESERD
jgi:hypothetical protein